MKKIIFFLTLSFCVFQINAQVAIKDTLSLIEIELLKPLNTLYDSLQKYKSDPNIGNQINNFISKYSEIKNEILTFYRYNLHKCNFQIAFMWHPSGYLEEDSIYKKIESSQNKLYELISQYNYQIIGSEGSFKDSFLTKEDLKKELIERAKIDNITFSDAILEEKIDYSCTTYAPAMHISLGKSNIVGTEFKEVYFLYLKIKKCSRELGGLYTKIGTELYRDMHKTRSLMALCRISKISKKIYPNDTMVPVLVPIGIGHFVDFQWIYSITNLQMHYYAFE